MIRAARPFSSRRVPRGSTGPSGTTTRPTVAILGTGLVGASLGLALRRRGWRVRGWDRSPAALRLARRKGALNEACSSPARAVRGAKVVVLAVPPEASLRLLRALWPRLAPGAAVTSASGVQAPPARLAASLPPGPDYVGAHPLAGSERSGPAHARAELFRGATCVLSPGSGPSARLVAQLWRDAGCRLARLSPAEHDRRVAWTSHLPHALAAAYCAALAPRAGRLRGLSGGAFRDLTRVAGSDARLWSELCRANAAELRRAGRAFSRAFASLLRAGFPPASFRAAARARRRILG